MTTGERKILYDVMIHCFEGNDIGLLSGKMGIALALATYGRAKDFQPVEDLAEVLLTKVLSSLTRQTPIGFGKGLAGIGWGIEYLTKNGFMEIDTVEVCQEIDEMIMHINLKMFNDMSLEHGLLGILTYINAHIYCNSKKSPFDSSFITELKKTLVNLEDRMTCEMQKQYQVFCKLINSEDCNIEFTLLDYVMVDKSKSISKRELSLRNGLAGKLILQF